MPGEPGPRRRPGAAPRPGGPPTAAELRASLGPALGAWRALVAGMAREFPPLEEAWAPSKAAFGRVCRLRQKTRTLLYLIPGSSGFEVSAVLGDRAVALALAGDLPAEMKDLLRAARRYPEGWAIRLAVTGADTVPAILRLAAFKVAPG